MWLCWGLSFIYCYTACHYAEHPNAEFCYAEYHNTECQNAECLISGVIKLSVIILSVIFLIVIMLSNIMLNVVRSNVIMLSVVAPFKQNLELHYSFLIVLFTFSEVHSILLLLLYCIKLPCFLFQFTILAYIFFKTWLAKFEKQL